MYKLELSVVTLVVMIFIGRMNGLKSSPVPAPFAREDNRISPKLITVTFMGCTKRAPYQILIDKDKCKNVDIAGQETVIVTDPNGIKLRVFKREFCEGGETDSILYDPTSSQSIPFKVASFSISDNGEKY